MIAFVFALAALAAPQDDFDKVEVDLGQGGRGIYVLTGEVVATSVVAAADHLEGLLASVDVGDHPRRARSASGDCL